MLMCTISMLLPLVCTNTGILSCHLWITMSININSYSPSGIQGTLTAVLVPFSLASKLVFFIYAIYFHKSLIAQEIVHVLEHVEHNASSIFKLTFHWHDVYRNRLHQLNDNMCRCYA